MNSNSQKDKNSENLPKVEESTSVYYTQTDLRNQHSDANWGNLPEIVQQLIEKGLKQCDEGQLIPHEKVMSDVKKRFNIS